MSMQRKSPWIHISRSHVGNYSGAPFHPSRLLNVSMADREMKLFGYYIGTN
jgi:hypothetical protein